MLTDQEKDFLKLINRSPDAGGGWRNVSKQLTQIVREMVSNSRDLLEIEELPEDRCKVRITADGEVILRRVIL